MLVNRNFLLALILILPSGVFAQESKLNTEQLLNEAATLMQEGSYRLAIGNKLDPIIQAYELQYKDSRKRIYGSRSLSETISYLLEYAVALDRIKESQKNSDTVKKLEIDVANEVQLNTNGIQGSSESAEVIGTLWGDAHFMKGSALVSLEEYAEAKQSLSEAVALSPSNSMYLSEYTYTFFITKNYEEGLVWATKAEAAAQFSPEKLKKEELGRAKRNTGYALIELGRLDEAEKKYKEALKLDKNDQKAKIELDYIDQLRQKQKNK